ncbi:MAG: negative regulator of flagellin synthesis FlgM [Gammaproteobacteria bacterium]|jgi:negative regulator of flagellin synthesis FlgM
MASDINGVSGVISQQRPTVAPQNGPSTATKTTTEAKLQADDRVDLQATSQARALSESVRDTPVVDGKRVQALREAIASGNHQVDPNRVAEKLVALESEVHPTDA